MSSDGFFEAMDGGGHGFGRLSSTLGTHRILRIAAAQTSEAPDESVCTRAIAMISERSPRKKSSLSGRPQELHRSSTGFPQGRL
jgi:hypothetical protein